MEKLPDFNCISPIERMRPMIKIPKESDLREFEKKRYSLPVASIKSPVSADKSKKEPERKPRKTMSGTLQCSLQKPIKSKRPAKFLVYSLEEIIEMYEKSLEK